MPLYEYQCDACGSVFEKIEKFSDPPLTVHEDCGGHVHRLMTAPSFQFKGSGWYVNDYGRGGVKPEAKTDSNGGTAKSGSEAKSDGPAKTESGSKSEPSTKSEPSSSKSDSSSSSPATPAAKSEK